MLIRVAVVGSLASDELEKDASDGPDVSLLGELSIEQLWGHVSDGSSGIGGPTSVIDVT